jgi:U11/U12 small nuclear ribonucleoprotein SNRNP65
MNKMNLPPPFGPATMLPPNLAHREASLQLSPPVSPKRKQDVASDESEMSEEELKPQLLPTPVLPYQRRKKQRIVRPVFTGLPLDEQGPQVKRRKPSSGAETIFDRPRETRKVDLRLLIGATLEIAQSQSSDLALIAEEESNTGTFGTFDPPPRINEEQVEDDNDALGGGPMTDEELQNNRLPDTEFSLHSAFKNYSPGEPSSRLYVKNLSKKATEKGLRRVYSRYINPKSEEDMLRFDVRVMTEGRMKGQAFIGLPSETVATRALEETNGLKLHDRPICVQFARSAKAKQMDNRK